MTVLSFQPQRKTVLSHEIYHTLRAAILNGSLEPGTRIVEGTIANQMRVSRAPLREALEHLKRDGLLRVEHRETRVVSLTVEDIRELHLIRAVLETLLYQYAASRLTPDDLQDLNTLVARMQTATEAKDARTLADCDYEFHERLCLASGLPRVTKIWYEQHVLFRLWLNVVAKTHDTSMPEIAASHLALLEAIRAQDEAEIARQVRHHIYFAGPALREERTQWSQEIASFFVRSAPTEVANLSRNESPVEILTLAGTHRTHRSKS